MLVLALVGCFASVGIDGVSGTTGGVPVLGNGQHTADSVVTTEIATSEDGLHVPRDLAFNPGSPGELWVVNDPEHVMVIVSGADSGSPSSVQKSAEDGAHFMAHPSGLAFSDTGDLATIHEEDQPTQGEATEADFMGPTLWPADVDLFDGGGGSHLDMLHDSPDGAGIAWEEANAYWVFDGYHAAIARYDFHDDHGMGGTDHSDGEVYRCAEGEVSWVDGISSHLVLDPATHLLYIADTGNNRIAVLDTTTGEPGDDLEPNYDGGIQKELVGVELTTLVTGAQADFAAPSGVELHDGMLFVSDDANGRITALTLDGAVVDWLDTGLGDGALMGMAFGPDEALYAVDATGDRVLRFEPAAH